MEAFQAAEDLLGVNLPDIDRNLLVLFELNPGLLACSDDRPFWVNVHRDDGLGMHLEELLGLPIDVHLHPNSRGSENHIPRVAIPYQVLIIAVIPMDVLQGKVSIGCFNAVLICYKSCWFVLIKPHTIWSIVENILAVLDQLGIFLYFLNLLLLEVVK